jgi:hypothetical protein
MADDSPHCIERGSLNRDTALDISEDLVRKSDAGHGFGLVLREVNSEQREPHSETTGDRHRSFFIELM